MSQIQPPRHRFNLSRLATAVAAAGALFFGTVAAAAGPDLGLEYATGMGLTTTDIRTTVARIISYFLGFLGIVAVCLMLYAGFLWMTAGGEEEKVRKAKQTMVQAVIGLAIILSAYAITQFIVRAISEGTTGTGGVDGCPAGQTCQNQVGGGNDRFQIQGTSPVGPGPGSKGWPKNYAITVSFNRVPLYDPDPAKSSINPSTFIVKRCNPRPNENEPFNLAECKQVVTGTFDVDGGRVSFRPDSSPTPNPGDEKTYFEGDYWYYLQVKGGTFGQTTGTVLGQPTKQGQAPEALFCLNPNSVLPTPPNMWDTTPVAQLTCDRAIAFSNKIDAAPPQAWINMPKSPPGICADKVKVSAGATDDFLVNRVDFKLDFVESGHTAEEVTALQAALVNSQGQPVTSAVNTDVENPAFAVDDLYVKLSGLQVTKPYVLKATAYDGVPRASDVVTSQFNSIPGHCCDGVKNFDEVKVDCGVGSVCGACPGDACTADSQCASGWCKDGFCADIPVIYSVAPEKAGPGSDVTISGNFFGDTAGRVVFTQDKPVTACAPGAWQPTQVTVQVPDGAAPTGYLKLVRSDGAFYDAKPGELPVNGAYKSPFTVTATKEPGICYVNPNQGQVGADFSVFGEPFGTSKGNSRLMLGDTEASVKAWATNGNQIDGIVPGLQEGTYIAKVNICDSNNICTNTKNDPKFVVVPKPGDVKPTITEITPTGAPVDSYITILGSGFGNAPGKVIFTYMGGTSTTDRPFAFGQPPPDPPCTITWRNNYIVIKTPLGYECQQGQACPPFDLGAYAVRVRRQDSKESNTKDFTINTDPPQPGMCSITPADGPPGTIVTVKGEGFGDIGPTAAPLSGVEFYVDKTHTMLASGTYDWTQTALAPPVPGNRTDKNTWPKSGPVRVQVNNTASSNTIPFKVQDCNDNGGTSACQKDDPKAVCCPQGYCEAPTEAGQGVPAKPACAYGSDAAAYAWHFSTEVLPELPRVVRCNACGQAPPCNDQSPSPSDNSVDACVNASIWIKFTQAMDGASFVLGKSVVVEELACGSNGQNCTATDVSGQFLFGPMMGGGLIMQSYPQPSYNSGSGMLKQDTRYRVTLHSDKADAANSLRSTLANNNRLLDGNEDNMEGGDFSFSFRVRNTDKPCEIAKVEVQTPEYTIDHKDGAASIPLPPENQGSGDPDGFAADFIAQNCNHLPCKQVQPYDMYWDVLDMLYPFKDILAPVYSTNSCFQAVTANKETLVGSPAVLTLRVHPKTEPITYYKEGSSNVTVKFADPIVVAYAPNCVEACPNAGVTFSFNVGMNAASISGNTVKIYKCRNESCNPPYDPTGPVPLVPAVKPAAGSGSPSEGYTKFNMQLPADALQSGKFYRVRLKGSPLNVSDTNFIQSFSGVSLKGLNDGAYFTWKFRVKESNQPCEVDRTRIEPRAVTFRYVGDRAGVEVSAFGAPDACSPSGQELNSWGRDWQWSKVTSPATNVVAGFLPDPTDVNSRLKTNSQLPQGCTSQCLNIGSQNTAHQCGNGVPDPGEDCEINPATKVWPANCDHNTCLWTGTAACAAPTDPKCCGNGVIDSGETCDTAPGAGGAAVFPPGCKEPAGGLGCTGLGAPAGKSVCGDGFIGDGETCDDGNTAQGDGCSDICINEGTLPSCASVGAGVNCVNFCGNGIPEPGEDADCDNIGPGVVAAGCDQSTCRHTGTPPCTTPGQKMCCGNGGPLEAGEECELVSGKLPAGCTQRCLLAGSSYKYPQFSACGDGLTGSGEAARCETGVVPGPQVDPFQVIVAGKPFNNSTASEEVTAKVSTVLAANAGTVKATLSCVCRDPKLAAMNIDPQVYCDGQTSTVPNDLGCDRGGCCSPAPQVDSTMPVGGAKEVCRNSAVRISFNQRITQQSAEAGFQVAEPVVGSTCPSVCQNNPNVTCVRDPKGLDEGKCGKGGVCVNRTAIQVAMTDGLFPNAVESKPGFLRRLWNKVKGVLGAVTPQPAIAAPTTVYCPVLGSVAVTGYTAIFSPKAAFLPNTWYVISAAGYDYDPADVTAGPPPDTSKRDAKIAKMITGVDGTPLQKSYLSTFLTKDITASSTGICEIDYVEVVPTSQLFTSAEDEFNHALFEARAHPQGGTPADQIVSVNEYKFNWLWNQTSDRSSILVIAENDLPKESDCNGNGLCEYAQACSNDMKQYCSNNGQCASNKCAVRESASSADCHSSVPTVEKCGDGYCSGNETYQSCPEDCAVLINQKPLATVRVRTQPVGAPPYDQGPFPRDGQETVSVTANVFKQNGTVIDKQKFRADADVTVMLCTYPWPKLRKCGYDIPGETAGNIQLPWNRDAVTGDRIKTNCQQGEMTWYPFFDPDTNLSFYYCRDGVLAGDSAEPLPPLNEEKLIRIAPTRPDVFREYLFTYDLSGLPPNSPWAKNAIGLRIMSNPKHMGINEWYAAQGFSGTADGVTVGGDAGLKEGRTVYVSAAALNAPTGGSSSLFTNVNVLSYSEGAAAETVSVFNRLLSKIDLNRNIKDRLICVTSVGQQMLDDDGNAVYCDKDYDCQSKPVWECKNKSEGSNCTSKVITGYTFPSERSGSLCLADKSKVRRDVQRWADLLKFRRSVVALKGESYPRLESGTYLRGRTYTVWPSWYEVLSKNLGLDALPVDPVNLMMACPSDEYSSKTCWSESKKLFSCPAGSHVYEFVSAGGANFAINADFEGLHALRCSPFKTLTDCGTQGDYCSWISGLCVPKAGLRWAGKTCLELNNTDCTKPDSGCVWNSSLPSGMQCQYPDGGVLNLYAATTQAPNCSGVVVGGSGFCGDGIVQSGEACEPASPPGVENCTDSNGRTGSHSRTCNINCTWGTWGACKSGYCGDGVVQKPELCDDGTLNGTYGHCDKNCSTANKIYCGDGQKQPNEACDCGAQNGSYRKNGILQVQGSDTVPPCSIDTVYSANANSCNWNCSGVGPFCGDGIRNGDEQCDTEVELYPKRCGTDGDGCNTDGDCPAGVKCSTLCDPAKPERKWRRVCGSNLTNTDGDDAGACKWGSWICTAPGVCGNGTKDTGEQCDDGNTNNNDLCVIDALRTPPYMCKDAVCGDGYVSTARQEQCDDGAKNGQKCLAPYGLTCNHCSTACKLITLSGGYCGDNVVQNAQNVPPGPEECELGQSKYLNDYVCVSTKDYDQHLGVFYPVGNAAGPVCDAKTCKRSCPKPFTQLCKNTGAGVKSSDFDLDGLADQCDPDKDNDGVPDNKDCGPMDNTVYGPWDSQPYIDDDGNVPDPNKKWTIAAHQELCDTAPDYDNKDNDCDLLINERIEAKGKITNVQTGQGMPDMTVHVKCGENEVVTEKTGSDGTYDFSKEFDTMKCVGVSNFDLSVTLPDGTVWGDGKPKELCPQGSTSTAPYTLNKCVNFENNFFASIKPKPNSVRINIDWSPSPSLATASRFATQWRLHGYDQNDINASKVGAAPPDVDLHMFDSDGTHVYYGNKTNTNGTAVSTLDIDNQNGGPETITVENMKADVRYAFRYYAYSSSGTLKTYALVARKWGVNKLGECDYDEYQGWDTHPLLNGSGTPTVDNTRWVDFTAATGGKFELYVGETGEGKHAWACPSGCGQLPAGTQCVKTGDPCWVSPGYFMLDSAHFNLKP